MRIARKLTGLCILALLAFSATTLLETGTVFAEEKGERGRGRDRHRGRGGRMGGKARLLTSNQVREELKVTEDQGKALDEILAKYRDDARALWSGLRRRGDSDKTDEDRKKQHQEARKKHLELRKAVEAKIASTLDAAQNERLDQIALQHQGVDALSADRVSAALELSDEQKTKIHEAIAAMRKEMRPLRRAGRGRDGGDRREMRKKMEKLRNSTRETVMALLTEEQTKKFEELKGEPFDLDRRSLRGGRGRDGDGKGRGKKDRKKGKRDFDEAI